MIRLVGGRFLERAWIGLLLCSACGRLGFDGGNGESAPPPVNNPAFCAALPAPSGATVEVTPAQVGDLALMIKEAAPGTTFLLAAGRYSLTETLWVYASDVTVRSQSGERGDVVLDGDFGDIAIGVQGPRFTLAHLTVANAAVVGAVFIAPDGQPLTGTRVHDVRFVDFAGFGVQTQNFAPPYADDGTVSCSSFELSAAGRDRANC